MSTRTGRTFHSIVWTVAALLAVLFALAYWFGEGHGSSLSQLARVRTGMSREQVVALLGRPGTVNCSEDGSESWYFTRWTFCQAKVYFAADGTVEETDHDH
ncbi:SmpA / OmlA family protein [Aquisphaera giovannonii]|uniref:SmpA / OmlA family protein n=1 Tax=Aquisphaera giovannonii TaxID=406548 RepID=A0A5B9VTK0_9BACT|nr:outer membrane protein assembly factor BamE [Aquisphaera giovannonii]QEH31673.1 SmpA / OmlA family protein [Aquisphaera giovannonii]